MAQHHRVPAAPQQSAEWHAPFLALLPRIRRHARRSLGRVPRQDREEAMQAVIACAAVAYARLFHLNKAEVAYALPLAEYGMKHFRAGRLVGGRMNSRDVGSACCQRRRGCAVESLEDWKETITVNRRTTPAEIAALRIDFGDWLRTLSPRNRKLANALARGEETSVVAGMFRLTAGRVSQLRRELYVSWKRFQGEPLIAAT